MTARLDVRLGVGDLCRRKETSRRSASPGRLGVTPRTLARWIRAGDFPAPHYLNGRRAWWLAEVEVWEATQAARPPELKNRIENLRPAPEATP